MSGSRRSFIEIGYKTVYRKNSAKTIQAIDIYRPVCLLDRLGKLLKRIVLQKLERHIDANKELSPK